MDYVTCLICRAAFKPGLEQCPKCRTNSYAYKSSSPTSELSEREDFIFKVLSSSRRREILRFLAPYVEKSRREIADKLDVSLPAATKHCNKLIDIGLISEIGRKDSESKKQKRYLTKYFRNVDGSARILTTITTILGPSQ